MSQNSVLKLHHIAMHSQANGPGIRMVLWTQGCTLNCPGCYNPGTHTPQGGQEWQVDELLQLVQNTADTVEGITLSGGEPLQQIHPLTHFLQQVRQTTPLSILLFSGFSWDEIQTMPTAVDLMKAIDVLITGRFEASQRIASGLIGSSNKTVHLISSRYTHSQLQSTPTAEALIHPEGTIQLSGIDPLIW